MRWSTQRFLTIWNAHTGFSEHAYFFASAQHPSTVCTAGKTIVFSVSVATFAPSPRRITAPGSPFVGTTL